MARRTVSEEELALTRKILGELCIAFLVVAIPYLLVGLFWADTHSNHLAYKHGIEEKVNWAAEVVAWPVLVFFDLDLR